MLQTQTSVTYVCLTKNVRINNLSCDCSNMSNVNRQISFSLACKMSMILKSQLKLFTLTFFERQTYVTLVCVCSVLIESKNVKAETQR